MSVHNEQRNDEVFVGNFETTTGEVPDYLSSLKTARVGSIAYYIDGKIIPPDRKMRPLFIGRSERCGYGRIMEAMTNENSTRLKP